MENPQKAIDEAIGGLGIEGNEANELRKNLTKITSEIFEKGKTPFEAMGLSKEMIEGLYSFGYRMYNTGQYDQATQLFRLLILLDPTCPKYVLGLAACFHMQEDYENAATTYVLCGMIDLSDPMPSYHASDCYINLNKNDLAIEALKACIERIGDRMEFDAIRDRAQVTLDMLLEKGEGKREKVKRENAA